ncbi:hypothetical protein DVR14_01520 (plasmid) [Natrinema thermotolerans]|nr:hypothetical protein DVR14_01520 [Natrinema thermotolerans]
MLLRNAVLDGCSGNGVVRFLPVFDVCKCGLGRLPASIAGIRVLVEGRFSFFRVSIASFS